MKRVTLWTISLGIGIATLGAGPASAQPRDNRREAVQDEREIRTDRGQLAGDLADVRWLERKLALLDRAHAARRMREEERIRKDIRVFLRRETAEARRDLAQDRREAGRSAQELESERREMARDARELERERTDGRPGDVRDERRDLRGDARDLRDDRRDVRDDRSDAAASARRLERQKAILRELRRIQPDVRRRILPAMNRERALFEEFLKVAKADARATGRELMEDRGERREDRRERREGY
jgi:hypothetical protein